jgi:hypothetical protein
VGLWRAPRKLGLPLAAVLAAALAFAAYFRVVDNGEYFYFKVLSTAGPLLLVAAVAALGRGRTVAVAALAALAASALFTAREEVGDSFDQLSPTVIELRDWSKRLPPDASVRIDDFDGEQLWEAYMLSDRPIGSLRPILQYPHVPFTLSADYALAETGAPRPADALGEPVLQNAHLRLWPLRRGRAPDTTSRAQLPRRTFRDASRR